MPSKDIDSLVKLLQKLGSRFTSAVILVSEGDAFVVDLQERRLKWKKQNAGQF
jgi:hypothetical protein